MRIKSITKLTEVHDRYDITVGETSNFYANGILIHNSSQRVARNYEIRPLKWWEKVINRFTKVDATTLSILNGTRRVVLNRNKMPGFHPEELREKAAAKIAPYLEEYMQVYFEVVGYEPSGKSIMPGQSMDKIKDKALKAGYPKTITYTYGCPAGEFDVYVYRIAHVLPNGKTIDMLWDDVKNWCLTNKVKHVPELGRFKFDGDYDGLVTRVEALSEGPDSIDPRHPKEGVCVRADGNTWRCYKEKQFLFKVLEGFAKEDDNYSDIEEEQNDA